jgi:hypothetical protein
MTKLSVITDASGKLLGAVRSEPFKSGDGKTLQFVPHPGHRHREIEVDDRFLRGSAKELGTHLREKLK